MQIKKINNNKLKVFLNSNDLYEKNIDIDSFLSNSIESQDLFFEILDLAQEKYNFDIENNKAVVEAISLNNNLFILTITKFKNENLNISNKYSKIFCFENINDIFNLYLLLNKSKLFLNKILAYKLSNKYYIILDEKNEHLENIFLEYSSLLNKFDFFEDILIEYGKKINIGV